MEELNQQSEKTDKELQREHERAATNKMDQLYWNKKGIPITKKNKILKEEKERGHILSYLDDFNDEFGFEDQPEDMDGIRLLVQYVTAERMKKLINILVDVELLLIDSESKNNDILSELKEIKAKLEK